MPIWNKFCEVAGEEMRHLGWKDPELWELLNSPVQPPRNVDNIGRPQRGSVLANRHPDPENYQRVISIRRSIAEEQGEAAYASYANMILKFLNTQGPFSDENQLFIVDILTLKAEYEFLYASRLGAVCAQEVRSLPNCDR